MPNHITNRLILSGNPDVIKLLKESIKTKHKSTPNITYSGEFIYEKIDNKKEYGWFNDKTNSFSTRIDNKIVVISTNGVPNGWKQDFNKAYTQYIDFEKIIPPPQFIFRGNLSSQDEDNNPNRNWLVFNTKMWGTKWNAYCTRLDKKGNIIFETAWSYPQPILERLSWLFPEINIKLETLDEGSNFWGTAEFSNGKMTNFNIKAYKDGLDSEYKRLKEAFRKR